MITLDGHKQVTIMRRISVDEASAFLEMHLGAGGHSRAANVRQLAQGSVIVRLPSGPESMVELSRLTADGGQAEIDLAVEAATF